LPVLDLNFGAQLFASEPLAAPFVLISLITITKFWNSAVLQKNFPYSTTIFLALCFGIALGVASYFRDIYGTFTEFSIVILFVASCLRRNPSAGCKRAAIFCVVSFLLLIGIQYPWEKRNELDFGEYTMSASTYYGYYAWVNIWDDNAKRSLMGDDVGYGLGRHLDPKMADEVTCRLNLNKTDGSKFAFLALVHAVCNKPLEAFLYKARNYDVLWFGQRFYPLIYSSCLALMVLFWVFLFLTKFEFKPGIWLFPLFLLCISPVIHYEQRYTQPFNSFIAPITAMYVFSVIFSQPRNVARGESIEA
jgi:hypothetical protein